MNLLEQAKLFATMKHVLDNRQLYGNLVPYTHHLAAVEAVLVRFGFLDEVIRVAAWGHDVIEDTRGKPNEVKRRDIEEIFGEDVADLVWAVTSEDGPNRKTRNALTYPKIREAGPRAVALKLADRIANVENGGKAIHMYRKEHADFKHGVYLPTPPLFNDKGYVDAALTDLHRINAMQIHLDNLIDPVVQVPA